MRLIDADVLRNTFDAMHALPRCSHLDHLVLLGIKKYIDDSPTIDAAPVVHARWVNEDNGYKDCSKCGCEHPIRDARGYLVDNDYCPKCGAKMDGGVSDATD